MTSQTACVFIDSNNSNQSNLNSRPIIKVPFPPQVDPRGLIKVKNGKIPSRVPNAFIIYRKMFIETARNDGYYLPMSVVSSMTSQLWEQENDVVKDEYKRLAKEAYDVRNEMLPKSQRKRKREKWNIITFEKQTRKSSALKTQKLAEGATNKSTAEVKQLPSPISSPAVPRFINYGPTVLQSEFRETSETNLEIGQFNFDFDFSQYNVPAEISSIEEIINSIDFNDNQLLPSPDLSSISSPELNPQYKSSSELPSYSIRSPIITEEELFDLLVPINEDYHINTYEGYEGLGISDSIEVIPTLPEFEEMSFSSEMLDIYTYNDNNYY